MQIHMVAVLLKDSLFLGGIIIVWDPAVAMATTAAYNNKVLCVVR